MLCSLRKLSEWRPIVRVKELSDVQILPSDLLFFFVVEAEKFTASGRTRRTHVLIYRRKAAYGFLNERYGCLEFIWLLDDKGEKASHEQIRDFESNGVGPLS